MFVGPYVVVVEGPTEAAIFNWFSRWLVKTGREGLDIRWAICPAEGASKVSSFATLFKGRGLKISALMDYHNGQKGMVNKLEESGLLEPGCLFKTTDYVQQDEADIEDVIGREMYIDLVNKAYDLDANSALPLQRPVDAPIRVVKEVEAHFALQPRIPEFDHYFPFGALMGFTDTQVTALSGLDNALIRFENLFSDLNRLINN